MPRTVIKGQALTDFIVKFTTPKEKRPEETPTIPTTKIPKWGLYMDGSSNEGGSEAIMILVSPEGHRMHCALKFGFTSGETHLYDLAMAFRGLGNRSHRPTTYRPTCFQICCSRS